jgi:hypothetical protein
MSNDLAIATVTATLKRFLGNALTNFSGASITIGQPEKDPVANDNGRVNIFLYQVTQNSGWRNADLPTRRPDGSQSQRPQLALDLHYLFSFYGSPKALLPERLMGRVMKALHGQPVLTRSMIQRTLENTDYPFLESSNLAEQPELVKFTPIPLSLEELSKIWSIFFQTQYVLSMAYQGTVVLIESDYQPEERPPVRDRTIDVTPAPPASTAASPTITQILAQAGAEEPITPGSTLVVRGQDLTQGAIAFVQVDQQQIPPSSATLQGTDILVALPDSIGEGVKTLQIIYQNGVRSNLARFAIRSVGGGN